jgi:hypothetical protein
MCRFDVLLLPFLAAPREQHDQLIAMSTKVNAVTRSEVDQIVTCPQYPSQAILATKSMT